MNCHIPNRQSMQEDYTALMRRHIEGMQRMTTTTDFTIDSPTGHITRDGRKARIICTDAKDDIYPIVALIERANGTEYCGGFDVHGREFQRKDAVEDLINAPAPRRTVWRISLDFDSYDDATAYKFYHLAPWYDITEVEIPPRGTGLAGGGE